jgi:glycosyltransferase involved in cell wall biosynthesis
MKLGIYIGSISLPASGGAYTLFESIEHDIVSSHYAQEVIIFFDSPSQKKKTVQNNIKLINLYRNKTFFYRILRKLGKLFFRRSNFWELDSMLHKLGIDLLWILGPIRLNITIPYVFTVWDLGHRMLPCFPEVSVEGWDWDSREECYIRMLPRATYVITGNETGKKEILANYSINSKKIHIIPFPIPQFCFNVSDDAATHQKFQKPFIFYPAQFWAHKNHIAIIEALAWLRDTHGLLINCYFVGSDHGNQSYISNAIGACSLENQIHILGFVDRPTLLSLYKNALAMTYMSLMGPNNLPPLEAAALGCPLILSNIDGHREQMEDAAIFVDATTPHEIGRAILLLHSDIQLRHSLIEKGRKFVGKYKDFSYFSEMKKIISKYELYQKTWKS